MKALFAALMMVSTTAMANSDLVSSRPDFDHIEIEILSYCDGDVKINRVTNTSEDCAAQGLVCHQFPARQRHNTITHFAGCVAK
ncbi:hypothetical protein ACES2L_02185 [Bdellovibrio bacteriovorus]